MRAVLCRSCLAALLFAACHESAITAPEDAANLHRNRAYGESRTYEVTIANLTTAQPFSPGVIVTHRRSASNYWSRSRGNFKLFQPGRSASEGLRLIAENGDPSVALADLMGAHGVADVVATAAPIHRVGGPGATSLTTTITASNGASHLSLAVMLICTNDGFVGARNVRLPRGGHEVTAYARAYDAGTEVNEESYDTIVPPCGLIGPVAFENGNNDRTPENGKVRHHRGITGIGDLDPTAHNWERPVAKITVRRID